MELGINLYSLHGGFETEKELETVCSRLKAIGYDYVQYSGGPFEVERIKRVSERTAMPVRLTHAELQRILEDTDALIDEHLYIGCKNIGLGYLTNDFSDDVKTKEMIADLEQAAVKMEKKGCKFFFHHHFYEFYKMSDGRTVMEYILDEAKHINFTVDTYWLQYGGADLTTVFDKLDGRMACVHLKDYRMFMRNGSCKPGFAPVGDGTMNFPYLIDKMKAHGAELFMVEQDDAISYDDPYEQLKRSVDYIRKIT